MKASELIAQLQALVEEHGDLEVVSTSGRVKNPTPMAGPYLEWERDDSCEPKAYWIEI